MGGLISRYALRDMELRGETHKTRLFISHDSPHRGANVPLAIQAFYRHLMGTTIYTPILNIGLRIVFPELFRPLKLLQEPAPRQMLRYQSSGVGRFTNFLTTSDYDVFMNEYHNMGYPVQNGIRNVSSSNGSECAQNQGFGPYAVLFTIITAPAVRKDNGALDLEVTLHSLPNQQALPIYKCRIAIQTKPILGFIVINKELYNFQKYSTTAMLPIDNAPGGFISLDASSYGVDPSTFPESVHVTTNQFGFVPTASGLGIPFLTTTDLNRA